jgi:phosphomannomutase
MLITLRTSGTEPKIKYYTEFKGEQIETSQNILDDLVVKVVGQLLEPGLNNLS